MTGEQKPGGLAQRIYDCPTTFDGDAIGTHLGLSMMVDQSTSTVEDQRRVVMSMCDDIARMILAEPAEARVRELEREVEILNRRLKLRAKVRDTWKDRATAAEAKLARAVEGLERIANSKITADNPHWWRWALNVMSEARQTLAALQQEGE